MFLLEVERIEAQLKEVEGKYHIADEESKEASQSYENIKSEYEKLEQDMASMDDKIASIREEMSQSTVTKGKLEGQINVLNEQIHTAEMTDEHLKSRLDSIDREKQERIESQRYIRSGKAGTRHRACSGGDGKGDGGRAAAGTFRRRSRAAPRALKRARTRLSNC